MATQNDSEFTYHLVATDDDHYFLKVNVGDEKVKAALAAGGALGLGKLPAERKNYLYRKMSPEEALESIKQGKILYHKTQPQGGEKWMTETLDHTRQFNNRGAPEATTVVEYEFPKKPYVDDIGGPGATIPQEGSGAVNTGNPQPKNLTHRERLPEGHPKQNIGLKGKHNIDKANQHLISVREIDPASRMNKYKLGRWMRRNKLKGALALVGIALDGAQLIISMVNDKGFGKESTITLSEIVGGALGAAAGTAAASAVVGVAASTAIGAAMGSFLPGIGNFIGALIGGIIGGIAAGSLTNYIFGYFSPPTAPGPGAPALDVDPFPDIFNAPPLDVDVSTATGAPSLDVDVSSAFGVPDMDVNVSNDFPGLGFDLQAPE